MKALSVIKNAICLAAILLLVAFMHPLAFIHPHEHTPCDIPYDGSARVEVLHHHCLIPDEGVNTGILTWALFFVVFNKVIHQAPGLKKVSPCLKRIFAYSDRGPPIVV